MLISETADRVLIRPTVSRTVFSHRYKTLIEKRKSKDTRPDRHKYSVKVSAFATEMQQM